MGGVTPAILVPLDEALAELNATLETYKLQNDINAYNMEISIFICPEINSDKIDNLEPYKYTVEAKRHTNTLSLDIYNKPGVPTSNLTDTQIKKLKELNDYLKQPGMMKSIKIDQMKVIIPFCIIVILVIVFLFSI